MAECEYTAACGAARQSDCEIAQNTTTKKSLFSSLSPSIGLCCELKASTGGLNAPVTLFPLYIARALCSFHAAAHRYTRENNYLITILADHELTHITNAAFN